MPWGKTVLPTFLFGLLLVSACTSDPEVERFEIMLLLDDFYSGLLDLDRAKVESCFTDHQAYIVDGTTAQIPVQRSGRSATMQILYNAYKDRYTSELASIKDNQSQIRIKGRRAVLSNSAYDGNKTYHFQKRWGQWKIADIDFSGSRSSG